MTEDDEKKATELLDGFECLLASAILAGDAKLVFFLCDRVAKIMSAVHQQWYAMAEKRYQPKGAVPQ